MVKKSKVVKDIDFEEVKNEEELTDNEKVIKFIKELVPYVVILLFVIVLRTYVVTPIKVNGSSMDPTLNGGEIMLLTKYDKDELKRHDIVIVNVDRIDGINEDVIKRIIALPGETISCERGQLFLNGKKYTDEYGDGYTNDFETIKLGKDEYFILGDNRDDSYDSSELGPVNKSQIKGHANLVIFPFGKFGNVK